MAVSMENRRILKELHNVDKYPEAAEALEDLAYEIGRVHSMLEIMWQYDPEDGLADHLTVAAGIVRDLVGDLWCASNGECEDRLVK